MAMKEPFVSLRISLSQHPKVLQVSRKLRKPAARLAALGCIYTAWGYALLHSRQNRVYGLTPDDLDAMTCEGFTEAFAAVGWCIVTPEYIEFPNLHEYQENMTTYREKGAERMRNLRARKAGDVAQHVTQPVAQRSRNPSPPAVAVSVAVEEDKQQQQPKFWTGPHRFHPDPAAVVVLCQFGMEERAAINVCSYIDAAEVERAVRYCRANGLRPGFIVKRVSEGAAKPWNAPDATTDLIAAAVASIPPSAFITAKEQARV
jgi:hypothetical protein